MKYIFLLFFALVIAATARAGQPWFFGAGEAVNLTNGTAFQNGVKNIAGALDPSAVAVNAPSGSMYFSTSGTIYVKQDAGLTTNWLPLGIATTGSLTTINGQSGPNVNIASGSSGTDFNIAAGSNTITLNLPSASASNRGLLTSADYAAFLAKQDAITGAASTVVTSNLTANRAVISNGSGKIAASAVTDTELGYVGGVTSAIQTQLDGKEPTITGTTSADYYRGDKTFQPLNKSAVGLSNVDNTSDANKPVSTATQTALDLKVDGAASSVDSELMLYSGTTGKASKRATGSGYAKLTSGVLSTSANVPASDLSGQVALANGGTNKNMTASAGAVVVSDADSMELTAVGTSGQILQSNGTSAPSFVNKSISGKAQNKTAITLEEIQVPNDQLTLVTGNKYLAETGNKNILSDASFEGANAGAVWSLSAGSFVSDNTPIDGLLNGQLTLSSQSLFFSQDSTLYQSQFADGVQGLASIRVRTSVTSTPIYVCYRQAGNTGSISNGCVQVQANGKWGLYKVPFILGATSNGIAVTSNGVAITGDVEVDDAFVGAADLKQDINVVGPWTNGTCVSSHTTNTTTTCKYRQVGDSIEVQERNLYSGAPNAASLTFGIPSGFTVNTSKLSTTSAAVNQLGIGTALDNGVSFYQMAIVYGSSTSVSALAQTASGSYVQNGSASNTIPFSFGASDEAQATFIVPVNELNGASSVYTAQNADTGWTSCGHTTSDFIGFGTVTNIETQCKRDNDDLLMKGKFTVGTTTATEARLNLKLNGVAYTSAGTSKIPSLQLAGDLVVNASSTTYFRNSTLIEPSVAYITMGAQQSTTNAITKMNGSSFASSSVLSFNARIPINGWDNSNVIIGTFNEVMTTPGITKPKTCYYAFGGTGSLSSPTACTAASCTEYYDNCNSFSTTSRGSTGAYTFTISPGTFATSSFIACSPVIGTAGGTYNGMISTATLATDSSGGYTNGYRIATGATVTDGVGVLKCEGQAP